jgi:hypothetical protein
VIHDPQYFKGDAQELKYDAAGKPAFDACEAALDQFFESGYTASDFLLMLYDSGRMPFSARVPREAFVDFIRQAIPNFPFTGTFPAYLFILEAIFGEGTEVLFDVPDPGKLDILISTPAITDIEWIGREFVDGAYEEFSFITDDLFELQFRGISGIDSSAELEQLLSELKPLGIYTTFTLQFFELYFFVAEEAGDFDSMLDHEGNQIVFIEIG